MRVTLAGSLLAIGRVRALQRKHTRPWQRGRQSSPQLSVYAVRYRPLTAPAMFLLFSAQAPAVVRAFDLFNDS